LINQKTAMNKKRMAYLLIGVAVVLAVWLYYTGYKWEDPNVLRITSVEIAK